MSEDIRKLEQQLEQATAPGKAIDESLDAETRSLREGWLALGELIEAVQPPEDNSLEDNSPEATQLWLQYPEQAAPDKERKPAFWKKPVVLEVLAASLLIAAWIGWSMLGGQDVQKIAKDNQPQQNEKLLPAPNENNQPVLVKHEQTPLDSTANTLDDELAWDAPIDTEIAAAGQRILSIKADWYASSDSADSLYYRMQQMQENLGNNTL